MNWMNIYRSKVTDVKTAVSRVKSGERIYLGGGAGIPQVLVNTLVERAPELKHVELVHMLHFGEAPYVQPRYAESFVHNALFIGGNVREAIQRGQAHFTPVFLSEIPYLFRSGRLPLDYAFIQLSPMNTAFAPLVRRLAAPNRLPNPLPRLLRKSIEKLPAPWAIASSMCGILM